MKEKQEGTQEQRVLKESPLDPAIAALACGMSNAKAAAMLGLVARGVANLQKAGVPDPANVGNTLRAALQRAFTSLRMMAFIERQLTDPMFVPMVKEDPQAAIESLLEFIHEKEAECSKEHDIATLPREGFMFGPGRDGRCGECDACKAYAEAEKSGGVVVPGGDA